MGEGGGIVSGGREGEGEGERNCEWGRWGREGEVRDVREMTEVSEVSWSLCNCS